jgi:hypothetical protein
MKAPLLMVAVGGGILLVSVILSWISMTRAMRTMGPYATRPGSGAVPAWMSGLYLLGGGLMLGGVVWWFVD